LASRRRRLLPDDQAIQAMPNNVRQWRKRLGVEPSPPASRGATGFEDREGHRAPFASVEYSYSLLTKSLLACVDRARPSSRANNTDGLERSSHTTSG
jgi:hypothetical protein